MLVADILLAQHGEMTAKLRNARRALDEAQAPLHEQTDQPAEFGEATDVCAPAAVLTAMREGCDVAGWIRTAEGQVTEATKEIERKVRVLKPASAEGVDIEAITVPLLDAIGRRCGRWINGGPTTSGS